MYDTENGVCQEFQRRICGKSRKSRLHKKCLYGQLWARIALRLGDNVDVITLIIKNDGLGYHYYFVQLWSIFEHCIQGYIPLKVYEVCFDSDISTLYPFTLVS